MRENGRIMRATPDAQRRLLDLAELDAQRVRLQHRANTMPEQQALKGLDQARTEHRAWVSKATGELEDAQAEQRRLESDVELVEQRLTRDESRLQASTSVKDIQGLEHEIASLRQRRLLLEDQELEVMERVESLDAELQRARSAQSQVELEAEELVTKRDAARAELQREAKVVAQARKALTPEIAPDLLALYEERRERYGVGAAELVGRVTTATNVTLDPNDIDRILNAAPDDVIVCPDSSAILVRTDRSVTR